MSAERLLSRLRRDERGATVVEFAIIIPVLITFLVGVFQVAWGMHLAATVRWTLEKEARTLLLSPTTSAATLKAAMVSDMTGIANPQSLNVTVTTDTSNPNASFKTAASSFTYTLAIPFLVSHNLTFNASTVVPTP